MRRRDKFRFLSWQQRRVLLYAFLILNTVRLALWLLPFGTIRQQLRTVMSVWICSEETKHVSVDFVAWAISVASYYAPGAAKCLAKALTTQLLLNRYGHVHRLHIGVAKGESQTLEAHAWIEYGGRVIVGKLTDLGRFTSLSTVGAEK